jgi:hypothetical protein
MSLPTSSSLPTNLYPSPFVLLQLGEMAWWPRVDAALRLMQDGLHDLLAYKDEQISIEHGYFLEARAQIDVLYAEVDAGRAEIARMRRHIDFLEGKIH